MIKKTSLGLFVALLSFSIGLVQTDQFFAQEKPMTVKDLIAKHLESIGSPEALAKVASRGMTGKAMVNFIQGARGSLSDGAFLCVSEGKNIGMTMTFKDVSYPGEHLAYNGKEISVKDITPGRKSQLADFLFTYNAIMKEGFLGGVLSTAWPLLKYSEGKPEFQLKQDKIGNREFYVLEKNIPNINIKLFFDVSTFRHMRTEYLVRHKENIAANSSVTTDDGTTSVSTATVGSRPADPSKRATIREAEPDSIHKLIEKFDMHAAIGGKEKGLILPVSYGIEFSAEGHGETFLAQWSVMINGWMNNGKVDQNFFIAQK